MQCQFDQSCKCVHCGYVARNQKTFRRCDASQDGDEDGVSVIGRVGGYAAAVVAWVADGMPRRAQEDIDAILGEHCQACPHFVRNTCQLCGCAISRDPRAMRNKLAMATEHCPIGRW